MPPQEELTPTSEPRATYSSGRAKDAAAPEVRLLHYNDVYHVDASSSEPVGGLSRFVTLCKEYQEGEQFEGQPKLLTLFSGDAFNPSLESSVTKGWSARVTPLAIENANPKPRQAYGSGTQRDWHRLCLCRGEFGLGYGRMK